MQGHGNGTHARTGGTQRASDPPPSAGMLSSEALARALVQHRAYADRSERPFAFLRFRIEGSRPGKRTWLTLLAETVAARHRKSDIAGWEDPRHHAIGLLLPNARQAGAQSVMASIEAAFAEAAATRLPAGTPVPRILCSMFVYPTTTGRETAPDAAVNSPPCMPAEALFGRPLPRWKRAMDVTGALIGLILLAPLFAALALYVKIASPGPVLFSQERVGFRGFPFRMWKFRTMRVHADTAIHRRHVTELIQGNGVCRGDVQRPMVKLEYDPQLIPFARLLRSLCLDELPQLFNVLCGEMSLIGPRPAIPYEVEAYAAWHAARFDCVPGMTGLWQVSGKNRLTFHEMVRLDIRYARTFSLWSDLWILLKTLPTVGSQFNDLLFGKE